MLIDTVQLKDVTNKVAKEKFNGVIFARRSLMDAVEQRLREMGVWESEDDENSGSKGLKSKGLARIDWSISCLKMDGQLLNVARDKWKVAPEEAYYSSLSSEVKIQQGDKL